MLRTEVSGKTLYLLWAACAVVGVLAALLVALGNPGNMGICGACFLRDTAGALGLFAGEGPRIFRPELAGLVLGAFLVRAARGKFEGRSGSYAGARFFLGFWMGIGTLVFLGCPFRMLQRIGGGDLNAVLGLTGFLAGVGGGRWFELRGYSAGKTEVVVTPVGVPALLFTVGGVILFLMGLLPFGPGPDNGSGPPPHAVWGWALGLALISGAILSLTGFCAVTAGRQVFGGPRRMLWATVFLILGYALVSAITGKLSIGFTNQPISHSDHFWNVLAMVLVGLTGVLAGGCPVRLVVLSGEGNGDAMVTAAGILTGTSLAHSMGMVSSTAGTTGMGRVAVGIGFTVCLLYAVAVTWARRKRNPEITAKN